MNALIKIGNLCNMVTYDHVCDATADMANIPSDQISLGSTCIVLEGEGGGVEFYMAKSTKEWVLVGSAISGNDQEET